MKLKNILLAFMASLLAPLARAEDGYNLWLRYAPISAGEGAYLSRYRTQASEIVTPENAGPSMLAARDELARGLASMLGQAPRQSTSATRNGAIVLASGQGIASLGPEGFQISQASVNGKRVTLIAANTEIGVLYGAFDLLERMQTRQPIEGEWSSAPRVQIRVLNHWDNLDGHVERGFSGASIFDWHRLPGWVDPRLTDYARANASIGVNGAVLTNVNANAIVLRHDYIEKAAAIAAALRPYGVKIYLTARFSAPIELGGLRTADPLDPQVRAWWTDKINEIYSIIPDFGGFLVKANSEGQPGPQDYHRTHADGANMFADTLAPHGGVVMWRAFVYSSAPDTDRVMQAYDEFVPLDGQFRDNVIIQVKNGPVDFQPREPFSPLFGAMPKTPTMMEFQITKEYLGFSTHLAYLATMWSEALAADTHVRGQGSLVSHVIDGSLFHYAHTGMAGVSNVGADRNWTGSHFDQANWYAFGRLAWDPDASAETIARDWARMTFTNDAQAVTTIVSMMMVSREAVVNYMTPLGLAHQFKSGAHYGPAPWESDLGRPDWNPVYYNRADANGIGFDRTSHGSNAVAQYAAPVRDMFENVAATPEQYLLWFHHLSWDYRLQSGETLWDGLVHHYDLGVAQVAAMRREWDGLEGKIDPARFAQVSAFLAIQQNEAQWWRDACIAYFQSISHRPLPQGSAPPLHDLDYYKSLSYPYAPGRG